MIRDNENEEIEKTIEYLKSYRDGVRWLALFASGGSLPEEESAQSAVLIRAKMFEVRRFLLCLPNGCEKIFLYRYYIKGETVEECAEALEVSVRTAYRIKARAHRMAANVYFDA